MMKRMLIALLACLSLSPLYALNNEEDRTIEFPKGVLCRFESQMTGSSKISRGTEEIMDTYICDGEDMGVLSVVYYEKREDDETRSQRALTEMRNRDVGDTVQTTFLTLVVFNQSKHLVQAFRYDADKRIEYISLVKTWNMKTNFFDSMDRLEVPATPVTAEE